MKNSESPSLRYGYKERIDIKLLKKVAKAIDKEFGEVLSGYCEKVLKDLVDGKLEINIVENQREFYSKSGGLDFSLFLEGEKAILDIEGMVAINPFDLKPKIFIKKEDENNPKGLADKICHEMLHYLGFQLEEARRINEIERIDLSTELLGSYQFEALIEYRFGPIKSLGYLLSLKEAPEVKVFLYLPSADYENSVFWEGVIDYYNKKIIDKLNLEGEYTAGYEYRYLIMVIIGALSNLYSEKTGETYEEVFAKFDKALKVAILSGNDTSFQQLVNSIELKILIERMKKTVERFAEEEKCREFAEQIKMSLDKTKVSEDMTSYEWLKNLVFNYYSL